MGREARGGDADDVDDAVGTPGLIEDEIATEGPVAGDAAAEA